MLRSLQHLQDYQNKLIYLVPEKQLLSERIKNAQLENTQSKCLHMSSVLDCFADFSSLVIKAEGYRGVNNTFTSTSFQSQPLSHLHSIISFMFQIRGKQTHFGKKAQILLRTLYRLCSSRILLQFVLFFGSVNLREFMYVECTLVFTSNYTGSLYLEKLGMN